MAISRKWAPLYGIILLLIVSNGIFFLLQSNLRQKPLFESFSYRVSDNVLTMFFLDDDQAIAATLGNDLVLRRDAGMEVTRVGVPSSIHDILHIPSRQEIMVGASNGVIYRYDHALNLIGEDKVPRGGVLGLQLLADDRVAASHGIGAYGDRFFVSVLDDTGDVVYTYQVGWWITALGSSHSTVLYGTEDARIGALDPAGMLQWETQVERRVTAISGWPDRRAVVAGDGVGTVYLLDDLGSLVWHAKVTRFEVTAVEPVADDFLVVGDSEGGLYVLDHEGQVLSSRSGRTVIAAIVPSRANQLTAIHRSGEMVLVDSTALRKNVLSRTLRSVSYALNGVWAVLLLVTAIHAVDRWRMKTLRLLRRISRSWQSYIFLLPSFILIFLFRYFAIEMGLFYSFTNYIPGNPVRVVGLANYVNIFTRDHAFWAGMGNMTLILVTSIIKVLTIPLLVALLVFRVRNPKAQYRWRVAFVIPTVVPGIVMVMMWRMMYDPHNGFMNALLQAIGLPHWRQAWLGNEKTALWSIIFAGFPWVSAFAFLIYSGGLVNINPELFDAGAIDGVGWWERFRFLEWPLLSPQRSLLLFFTFLSSMQGYADIFVYTQGGPGTATTVPALQMFLSLSAAMRVGYSSALGLILFCIVLFFTVLNRRISRSAAVSF